MSRVSNKITGANAGGSRQCAMRMRLAARIALSFGGAIEPGYSMRFRTVLIICLVVIIGVLLMLWSHSSSSAAKVSVSFAGFTNSGTSAYAVFDFRKAPPDVFYTIRTLEKRAENGWEKVPPNSCVSWAGDVRGVSSFSWYFPVTSTNAEYRMRVSITERALGLSGLRDKVMELYHGVRRSGNATIYKGRNYDVTSGRSNP